MSQKIALVTGASRGIGKACAEILASEGYFVVVHYRSDEALACKVAESISGSAMQADLSDTEQCEQLIQNIKKQYGRIDVLVNNAGMCRDQILPMAKPEDFDLTMTTNLKSTFLLSKYASRQMIRQKTGCFVHISSVVAHKGNPGQSIYAASKGAIESFSKSVAQDMASFGVRSNVVAPGFIETDMTKNLSDSIKEQVKENIPLKKWGVSEDVGNAVAFLCSEKAKYITGATLHVNGGLYC
ncbi:MAG: 3-oxoacyl-ACP reductase family protein [Oligoflexales bacterium]